MLKFFILSACLCTSVCVNATTPAQAARDAANGAFLAARKAEATTRAPYANETDRKLADTYTKREADWRNGALVYQVIVDRFAPAKNIAAKKHLYPAPKVLRDWSEVPKQGKLLPEVRVWSHEIDFWGGDIQSLASKLDYVRALGTDVLYLNPIHLGYTNHKYDALDYMAVSPEYGTRADVKAMTDQAHGLGMKVVLDGVFNHMGRNAPIFQEALKNPNSPYRDWFYFGAQYPGGARVWVDAENLPELNLENPKVRAHLYASADSVVQSYLRDGIDGWRLDTAPELGFNYLADLTRAAHDAKPGSLVVGEVGNYPDQWFPSLDAVMNFSLRQIILHTAAQQISPRTSGEMMAKIIRDAGIEPMLKSWLLLDNHDTSRIATELPDIAQRKLAQVLQFTLPGAPNLYYGSELGMVGGNDPEQRAPMRWDLVSEINETLRWTKKLIALRQQHRALRIGDFRLVTAEKLLAFERYTDRIEDSVIVLANPSKTAVTEIVMIPNAKLMNGQPLVDVLDESAKPVHMSTSLTTVTVPAGGVLILTPDTRTKAGYNSYKRVL